MQTVHIQSCHHPPLSSLLFVSSSPNNRGQCTDFYGGHSKSGSLSQSFVIPKAFMLFYALEELLYAHVPIYLIVSGIKRQGKVALVYPIWMRKLGSNICLAISAELVCQLLAYALRQLSNVLTLPIVRFIMVPDSLDISGWKHDDMHCLSDETHSVRIWISKAGFLYRLNHLNPIRLPAYPIFSPYYRYP